MAHQLGRTLITRDEIAARVGELGQAIGRDYAGRSPLLVAVLKGAVVFTADLIRAIPLSVGFEFMGVSSYGSRARTSGVVRLTSDLSVSIEGRDVIIVVDKVARREVELPVDYVGFVIPSDFVVGYGLDHDGLYRNLADILVLERAADS